MGLRLRAAAETETTLRRNKRAMSHYVFRPRVLRDVSQIDTTTTFLGMPLALPVMIAPMGSTHLRPPRRRPGAGARRRPHGHDPLDEHDGRLPARGRRRRATGPLIFQLYFRGDNAWGERSSAASRPPASGRWR